MIIRIKNNDTVAHTWVGQEIQPSAYYDIPEEEEIRWANDSQLIIDISNQIALVGDGVSYFSDVNQAINFLKNDVPAEVNPTSELIVSWSQMKTFYNALSSVCFLNYIDLGDYYYIWATFRDQKFFIPTLTKGSSDCDEFEASYKSKANTLEFPRTRNTSCKAGRKMHNRYITFVTSDQDNFDNTDYADEDYGDVTYTMKDISRNTTTDNSLAKETWIDWEPVIDYEIAGGALYVPTTLTSRNLSISSITQTDGVATATCTGHKLRANCMITISGADQSEYNGVKDIISAPTADTFTFAVPSGTTSPATGTITAVEGDDAWEIHVIAVPDIPAASGGSVQFIANPRIKWIKGGGLFIDSDLNPSELKYNATYHTNKIRILIKHPIGCKSEFQLSLRVFK